MYEVFIELNNGSGGSPILGKPEKGDDPLNQGNVNIDPLLGYKLTGGFITRGE